MTRFSFSSLRVRLVLLVLLAVIPALGLVLYTAAEQRRSAAVAAQEGALRLARLVSSDQEQLIEGARQLLVGLAQIPVVRGGDPAACNPVFEKVLKQFPLYATLGVTDAKGYPFCSAIPIRKPFNVADRAWFQRAVQTRGFAVGDYVVGRASGKASLHFGYPVLDDRGVVQAVVLAGLDLAWLNRLAAKAQLPEGSVLTMTDRNGTILARDPDPEKWVGKSMAEVPIVRAILNRRAEGTANVAGVDGIPRLYAFTPVHGAAQAGEVYVSVGIPQKVAFADADRMLARNLAALGIVGVLALVAAWFGSDLFVLRPVNALTRATKRLSKGDLSARTGSSYEQGELGQLARAFDEMADALQIGEAARHAAESRFANILDIAADAVIAVNESQRIVLFNKRAEQIFGYAAGEVLGRPLDLLLPSRFVEAHRQHMRAFAAGSETVRHMDERREVFGQRRDGTEFPAEASVSKLTEDGQTVFTVILRDITERKLAEQRITTLHDINAAITSTLDLRNILGVLLEKIDLFLPYATATTVRLFDEESGLLEPLASRNIDEQEWRAVPWRGGRGIQGLVFESKALQTIRNVETDPRVRDLEFYRKHKLISYLGVPLIVKDKSLGVLSLYTKEEHEFSDEEVEFLSTLAGQAAIAIQNSQLYEQTKGQAVELEKANKVKDEFLGFVSHELRTPVNAVLGYTGMMQDGMFGEINAEQEKILAKVLNNSNELLSMINSLLQAGRIEAGAVKVERDEVRLCGLLDELRSAYEVPLNKELNLVWDYPSNLPVVTTDREKLKHILQNLVNNAIKFTEKGSVTVSARITAGRRQQAESSLQGEILPAASCLLPPGQGWVEFKVADTGIGIAEDEMPFIFDMFRQVDDSQRRSGGVGLGLHIVRKFTELLGGKIEVESEPGKGSTFTVILPCEGRQAGMSGEDASLKNTVRPQAERLQNRSGSALS